MTNPDQNPDSELSLDKIELTPAWVKSPTKSFDAHSGNDKPRRGDHGDRPRTDRGERRPIARGQPSQNRPQKSYDKPAASGPPREPQRGPRRPSDRPDRPAHAPEPLAPVDVMFDPEPTGFAALLEKLKTSAHAYPLFDLAKLILNKPQRYQARLRRQAETSGERRPLHFVAASQNPFLNESDAIHYVMRRHFKQIARGVNTQIDPPKGNFTFVNRCGMTGEWLGAPNYHQYQSILIRHHQQRLRQVPFDEFKSRIQTVRDPEAIQKWLASMSVKSHFVCQICSPEPAAKSESPAPAAIPKPSTAEAGSVASSEEQGRVAESPPPDAAAPQDSLPVSEPAPADPAPAAAAAVEYFDSVDQVEKHFVEHHRHQFIVQTPEVTLSGAAIRDLELRAIVNTIRCAWEGERRFPIKTVNELRPRLQKAGFHFFKHPDGVVYLIQTRLKRFEANEKLTDHVDKIVSILRRGGGCKSDALMKQLLPQASAEAAAAPAVDPTPQPAEPVAVPKISSAEESILADLRWLIAEGYVVELADGRLWATPEKTPAPTAAPEPTKAEPAAGNTESVAATEPAASDLAAPDPEPPPANEAPSPTPEPAAESSPVAEK